MIRGLELPQPVSRCVDPSAPQSLRVAVALGAIPQAPAERLTTLARLLADPAPAVREAARGAWAQLPLAFFESALGDPFLPAPVIDLVVALHMEHSELVCRALEHPRVGAKTLDRLARSEDDEVLSRVARNQRVLNGNHELTLKLLENPNLHPAERSRLVSLCRPPMPDPPGEPEEELSPELPPELLDDDAPTAGDGKNLYQLVQSLTVAEKIKLATLGSKSARRLLIRDTNKVVAVAVIRSPKLREDEVQGIAQDRTAHEEIIRIILQRRDWLKNYPIRLALCQNPKTPIPKALRLLETMQDRDLRQIAKSRNVSSPVSAGAIRILARRGKI